MSQLYTHAEASKITGIPEGTIRSWLSRHAGVFEINVHIVIDEHKRKLWTEAGLELLRSRANASKNATADVAKTEAQEAEDLLEKLLEQDSQYLAREYWRLLPNRVLQRIHQMRFHPTPEDREIVTASVRSALNAGTSHLLLPIYQPMLLEGDETE